jgi:hypothetical protein
VLVIGDFNAYEFNDGYVDAMGTIVGRPSADSQTVISGDGADLVNPDYEDLTWLDSPDQRYSYSYDGNVQSLDHVIANQALMRSQQLATLQLGHARINADFPETARNDYAIMTRHCCCSGSNRRRRPIWRWQCRRCAARSLPTTRRNTGSPSAIAARTSPAMPPSAWRWTLRWRRWSCAHHRDGAASHRATATRRSQVFTLTLSATGTAAGSQLTLAASVRAQTHDPYSGNDSASAVVEIVPPASRQPARSPWRWASKIMLQNTPRRR